MTDYYNKGELFMEPKTQQYGNHMVMTNVHKPTKTKCISIDTKFRDDYDYTHPANFQVVLPERVNDVRSMRVTNIEIPITFYNISIDLDNNSFKIVNGANTEIITVDNNNYDAASILSQINTKLLASTHGKGITFANTANKHTITSTSNISIIFDVDKAGNSDKFQFKQKLGWLLGFRKPNYDILTNITIAAECIPDLSGPRYLYLAIDEFSKGNQNTFVTPLSYSSINKNIIARIALDMKRYGYGSILPANDKIGYLTTNARDYTGKVDLQKLQVQLLNESGRPIMLNGSDFSFCLEVICE
jgi:hypothetical protein